MEPKSFSIEFFKKSINLLKYDIAKMVGLFKKGIAIVPLAL